MKRSRREAVAGSVSIYFIAVTAAFVLLTGLLIDFSRIAAFRKQAELAVKSGARSVLSAYDPVLYERYGLFARGGNPADELFRQTLEGNVEPADGSAWRPLEVTWSDDSGVMESRPLAAHGIFRREVLEEMKYKAPIDLTIDLVSRFRGVAPAMKEAKASVDVLERMRQAYDSREAALDAALDKQISAGRKLSEAVGGLATGATDLAGRYDDYVQKRDSDQQRAAAHQRAVEAWQESKSAAEQNGEEFTTPYPTGGEPLYAEQTAAYERSAGQMADRLQTDSPRALASANADLEAAKRSLAEAQAANEEVRRIALEAERIDVASGNGGGDVDADAVIGDDKAQSVRELRRSVQGMALDDSYFAQYGQELDGQRSAGEELASAADSLASVFGSVPGSSGLGGSLRGGADRLSSLSSQYRGRYGGDSASVLADRRASFEAHRAGDQQRKQFENEAKERWAGATSWLGSMGKGTDADADRQAYDRLRSLSADNLKWNEAEEELAESDKRAASPDKGRDEALAKSDSLLDMLQDAAVGSRDSLYFAEYAAERLTSADPSAVRSMLSGQSAIHAEDQEMEYVLYGFHNASGNIAAAYGEIFAVRLAIRMMEGLIECRSFGHPLVVLAAALVYALEHALADMNQLLNEGKIPLSRYARVDTYYLDYLRLFMLLHGDSAGRIARCIAVMEAATGLSFQKTYTYVSGEATASLQLWFFPGLTKLLGQAGNWGGVVRDGRYEAAYRAEDSYL